MHKLLHSDNLKALYYLADLDVGDNVTLQRMFRISVGRYTLDLPRSQQYSLKGSCKQGSKGKELIQQLC